MDDPGRRLARAASCGLGLCRLLVGSLLVGGFLAGLADAGAAAATLAPHRAVYDMRLANAGSGGGLSSARGKMELEWADVCTGWTTNQRTRLELVYAEGQVAEYGWTLSSLEAKDGSHYRFFIRFLNADGPTERLRGEARLHGPGRGGEATYREPAPREVVLPKGTLFPTAHTEVLIEAMARGERQLWRTVFDGSGDEGLFGVNAVALRALPADREPHFDSSLLEGQESWRIHLAYFGPDEATAVPEQEHTLRLFANGVVDELIIDHGNFALRADLVDLEPLPPEGCR